MATKATLRAILRLCSNVRWKSKGSNFSTFNRSSHCLKCYSSWSSKSNSSHSFPYGFISISVIGLSSLIFYKSRHFWLCHAEEKRTEDVAGHFIKGLPTYKSSDVEKHKRKEDRIWVIYKNGVYDVTDFVDEHPGGTKILLAAGGSIEPFWLLYGVHNNPEVHSILEKYRIGNLHEDDRESQTLNASDPYSKDPQRHPALIPASRKPFNGEPPASLLIDEFYTPNEIFYVRNHLPVPMVNPQEYRLEISGLGVQTKKFTLDDLKKFPKHSVTSTVQCAGNRRSEMVKVKHVKGLSWNQAAIGNAVWSGAKLTDVLESCGFKKDPNLQHFQFEGMDVGPDKMPYGASVPAYKILDPSREVLLAYEMNGKELPVDHGYPIRIIVPGVVGARNVKWLTKIVLSNEESESFWQQSDYKGFGPSTDWDTVDFTRSPSIQDLPVNSAICMPENGESVDLAEGCVFARGYAYAGGGNAIVRVDVTANKGKTWYVADLEKAEDQDSERWSWALWSILIPVDTEQDEVEIWVKAVDAAYNTQPESFENIWNLRGLLANAYHKVKVKLNK